MSRAQVKAGFAQSAIEDAEVRQLNLVQTFLDDNVQTWRMHVSTLYPCPDYRYKKIHWYILRVNLPDRAM